MPRSRCIFVAVLVGSVGVSAAAELITFEFTGVVTSNDHTTPPWDAVPVSASAVFTYTFDPLAPDTGGGRYPLMSGSIIVGAITDAIAAGGLITVQNGAFGGDRYIADAPLASDPDFTFAVDLSSGLACCPLTSQVVLHDIHMLDWSNLAGRISSPLNTLTIDWTSFRIVPQPPSPPPPCCDGDADHNNTVNFGDITAVLANFNAPCP